MIKASNILPAVWGIRRLLLSLTLTCVLMLGWGAAAYAQTSTEGQYGSPTDSGVAALIAATKGTNGSDGSGGAALTSGDDTLGGAGSSGVLPLTGLLPETGGPALTLALLGVLSLGCGGLLSLRTLRSLRLQGRNAA